MKKLDDQEFAIVRELVRNPRISDNKLSKRTGIPVMSVNRKRKNLEKRGLIKYYTQLDTGKEGTGTFSVRRLYIIKFKIGISNADFISLIKSDKRVRGFYPKFVEYAFIGEKDGHTTLILIVGAEDNKHLVDLFNGKIITNLKNRHGEDAIVEVISTSITYPLRLHHNYLPLINMEQGILKDTWNDQWIFVDHNTEVSKQKRVSEF